MLHFLLHYTQLILFFIIDITFHKFICILYNDTVSMAGCKREGRGVTVTVTVMDGRNIMLTRVNYL